MVIGFALHAGLRLPLRHSLTLDEYDQQHFVIIDVLLLLRPANTLPQFSSENVSS